MNMPVRTLFPSSHQLTLYEAITSACQKIAPNWPLDQMIAINPYWERTSESFKDVAGKLAMIADSPMTMPMDYYRQRWQKGEISRIHLQQALDEGDLSTNVDQLLQALEHVDTVIPLFLLSDMMDRQNSLLQNSTWCETITQQIGCFCAAYFDLDQSDWHPFDQQESLYTSWRRTLVNSHSVPFLMKDRGIMTRAGQLADSPTQQIEQSLKQLAVIPEHWEVYLQTVLMRVSGWASWCAYRCWQARQDDGDDAIMTDLLAIRLSWESLIDDGKRHQSSIWKYWHEYWCSYLQHSDHSSQNFHLIWQRAHELSYQSKLFKKLCFTSTSNVVDSSPAVQAVFCIDVRSEVFRRHLENQSELIETHGFAGFFGLPVCYTPLATSTARPQLPGMLTPSLTLTDSTGNTALDQEIAEQRSRALRYFANWKPFHTMPCSISTLVESTGVGYVRELIKHTLSAPDNLLEEESKLGLSSDQIRQLRPMFSQRDLGGQAGKSELAAQVLKGMGLTEKIARLVLLVGHGSQSQNNPQRSGFDCGACCGQTGEVNSRALAGLLNDPTVRQELKNQHSITVPPSSFFIAALHNTTTDNVTLFNTQNLPRNLWPDLERINRQLASAGHQVRRERASTLGLSKLCRQPDKLYKEICRRANDWAQTRPEWGLANNAAMIIAPRKISRGLNLQGRSFLHDYDYFRDEDGSWLEQIMTAPMIVAHWINMQYYASTVDNKRYGSGNKTLHNVVGGRLGIFEGQGCELRIGLSLQSVHDGQDWYHQPLRLTVVIEAPREKIETIIKRHLILRQLLDNEWFHLARFEHNQIELYRNEYWVPWQF